MSVFLGFLEATERRDVTSAGTASCERLANTECMTAGSYRPTVDQMALVFFAFSLPFFHSFFFFLFPSLPPFLPYFFLTTLAQAGMTQGQKAEPSGN